jgi:hypothetical protein
MIVFAEIRQRATQRRFPEENELRKTFALN